MHQGMTINSDVDEAWDFFVSQKKIDSFQGFVSSHCLDNVSYLEVNFHNQIRILIVNYSDQ